MVEGVDTVVLTHENVYPCAAVASSWSPGE